MNSSRPKDRNAQQPGSTAKPEEVVQQIQQLVLPLDRTAVTPGSLNDSHMIRTVFIDALRRCGRSRAQVADDMSYLSGQEVTERRLNGFAAESREDLRFPAELVRAFCLSTGDDRLLKCTAEAAGYRVISGAEVSLLELGRQYLTRKRSEAELAELERRLEGTDL